MPDPDRLLRTLDLARQACRATAGRAGRHITLQAVDDLVVAGDLHGQLPHFQTLMRIADLGNHPRRHLVLQELIHGPFRYPAGGDKSHQMVDLYAALKHQYPQQVHYLLGNHELAQWTEQPIAKSDLDLNALFSEGIATAYGRRAAEIEAAYQSIFAELPLALRTPNRVWLCHTVPAARRLDSFDLRRLCADDLSLEAYQPGGMAHSLVWGRDVSPENVQSFLERVNADWLITGHIPCDAGYDQPSPCHLILDSAASPGAYAIVPAQTPLDVGQFTACVRLF